MITLEGLEAEMDSALNELIGVRQRLGRAKARIAKQDERIAYLEEQCNALLVACEAEEAVEPLRRAIWDAELVVNRLPAYAPKEEVDMAAKRWLNAHDAWTKQLNLVDELRSAAIAKTKGNP
jgi:hypothetical protein